MEGAQKAHTLSSFFFSFSFFFFTGLLRCKGEDSFLFLTPFFLPVRFPLPTFFPSEKKTFLNSLNE